MSRNVRVYDPETGEDVTELYSIRSRTQEEAYREMKRIEEYKTRNVGRRWVACYHEPIKGLMNLKLHELGALIKLIPYMRFNKNGLLTIKDAPMTIDDVAKIIRKSKKPTISIMNALEQEGVIVKKKVGRINELYISEGFHTIGEATKNVYYTKLYQVESRKLLDMLTIQEAGLLYKILPFFHFENYYLCSNPDEHEPKEINHLSHSQLSVLIGEDERTVYNNMRALIRYGAIMKVSAFGAVNYLVNPDLMFRNKQESEHTDIVRKQFAELRKTCEMGLH